MQSPANYSSLRRIGDFKPSARTADHDGWLLLDGRTISKSDYPKLFGVLGVTASTTQLPDAKDCLFIGAGGRLKVMEKGGSNEITLTVDNLPAHTHGYVDNYEEAVAQNGGLLSGLIKIMSGLTPKTNNSTTGSTGKATPVKLAPLALGANIFIYAGTITT